MVAAAGFVACASQTPVQPNPTVTFQVDPAATYTIQQLVDQARAGDTILVHPGSYTQRVVINKPGLKLQGDHAVLEGQGGGLGGTGFGIHIKGVSDVEVSGFTVQHFERGIVLENATNCRVRSNEVRENTAKTAPPFVVGITSFEGIVS
jgi:parallel beta-helix repeat protein